MKNKNLGLVIAAVLLAVITGCQVKGASANKTEVGEIGVSVISEPSSSEDKDSKAEDSSDLEMIHNIDEYKWISGGIKVSDIPEEYLQKYMQNTPPPYIALQDPIPAQIVTEAVDHWRKEPNYFTDIPYIYAFLLYDTETSPGYFSYLHRRGTRKYLEEDLHFIAQEMIAVLYRDPKYSEMFVSYEIVPIKSSDEMPLSDKSPIIKI
jgi:hypothetical protein